jgi:single-strand DNA-binding protein
VSSKVELEGRLGKSVVQRTLPSGDVITIFSVIVDREQREIVGKTSIDTIPCHTHRISIATKASTWRSGSVITVSGVLRRRFWKGPHGLGSALEVEVRALKRS